MKYWKTPSGSCYAGDRLHSCDIEVTERPPLTKEQEAEVAKEELKQIDTKSIRALRAIVLSLSNGEKPLQEDIDKLNEYELSVINERGKI